ncbi:MAG: hypothetical protein R6X32_22245 [Chloroflexota bacterium]|jgi:hypothetical protein
MPPYKLMAFSLAAFVLFFLAACGQTAVSDAVEPMMPPAPPPTVELTPTAMLTETAVAQPVDECAACHLDRERIIANLAPEEEVIKESEGVG